MAASGISTLAVTPDGSALVTGDGLGTIRRWPLISGGAVYAVRYEEGVVKAVDDVTFDLEQGQILGLVGESGCGKTTIGMGLMRLLASNARIVSGHARFEGEDLTTLSDKRMRQIRWRRISMIFQAAMNALNPVHRIGKQLSEVFLLHQDITPRTALEKSIEILDKVGIPSPEIRVGEYPHQLSGGMRQRVMIAIALACKPALVIADEPTTALDVTIQAQILELMKSLQEEMGMSILLITHDLGLVNELSDRIAVMYRGRLVETGSTDEIMTKPLHPYTLKLFSSVPGVDAVEVLAPLGALLVDSP